MIKYVEESYIELIKPITRQNNGSFPGQDEFGYGTKITSDTVIQFRGNKKKYRVYITLISNIGSRWIEKNGRKYLR